MSNSVEGAWLKAIEQQIPKTFEVDPSLRLRLVCGTDQVGQPIFCSISAARPEIPELSDAVEVSRAQRTIDGNWVLRLTLKASKFTDIFVQLCAHIIDCVAETKTEEQGLAAFMAGVEDWQTLLQAPPSQRLSLESARGLFGELWFGFHNLVEEIPVRQVMGAWRGPFQSDQDFQFPGGPFVEVKTIRSRTRRIQISSENQLHRQPDEQLYIALVTVEDAPIGTPGALTLSEMLDEVERLLRVADVAQFELTSRLAELRLDRSDDYYSEVRFLPTKIRYLEVAEGFPRLEPAMLPEGVNRVTYAIDLDAVAQFECELSGAQLSSDQDIN